MTRELGFPDEIIAVENVFGVFYKGVHLIGNCINSLTPNELLTSGSTGHRFARVDSRGQPPPLHLARSIMLTFDLILEHWQTRQLKFVTIEECVDLDDCLDHIRQNEPDFEVMQVRPA